MKACGHWISCSCQQPGPVCLPVVQSTAANTGFVTARIDGPDGRHLWIDGNQKISGYANPRPNAFSLVQVEDCPHSTPTCRASCYVHGLEKDAPDVHAMYRHNSATIRAILSSRFDSAQWMGLAWRWIARNCRTTGFRWHVSGDLFSAQYARWVRGVVYFSGNIRHWIYTRSFHWATEYLTNLPNLSLNFSCDRDNYDDAWFYAPAANARLCYLVTDDGYVPPDLPPGSVIFPDYALRGRGDSPTEKRANSAWWQSLTGEQRSMVCPTDFYSKGPNRVCGPCRKCIDP